MYLEQPKSMLFDPRPTIDMPMRPCFYNLLLLVPGAAQIDAFRPETYDRFANASLHLEALLHNALFALSIEHVHRNANDEFASDACDAKKDECA